MNTPPTNPIAGPPAPAQVPVSPYPGNIQVTDASAQPPVIPPPTIPYLKRKPSPSSSRPVLECKNRFHERLVRYSVQSQTSRMELRRSVNNWNKTRILGDDTDDKFWKLKMLLWNIWMSCYHHQEQLLLGQLSIVYSLQAARLVTWGTVVPVLLASFQV